MLRSARPNCQLGHQPRQLFGQAFHGESFAPVVAQEPQSDPQRFRFQTCVESSFAGDQCVTTAPLGGGQKRTAATTRKRNLCDRLVYRANAPGCCRANVTGETSYKFIQEDRFAKFADATCAIAGFRIGILQDQWLD